MESERGGVMSDSRYTRLTWKMGGLSCPYYSEEKKKVGGWREGRKIYLILGPVSLQGRARPQRGPQAVAGSLGPENKKSHPI